MFSKIHLVLHLGRVFVVLKLILFFLKSVFKLKLNIYLVRINDLGRIIF